jgi:hypothetical protein
MEVLCRDQVIARHARCYGHDQDVFDPLHYLPLLEQRPGAFEYAKPIRRWREGWPPTYEHLLERLRATNAEGRGVREFVRILRLHRTYPADVIESAIKLALDYGCVHADGVELCVRQVQQPSPPRSTLDLTDQPRLAQVGAQPLDLKTYDQLLAGQ